MNRTRILILGAVVMLSSFGALAQEKKPTMPDKPMAAGDAQMFAAAQMQWRDGPASLPAGAQFVVLDGDPAKSGSFTMRLKMPAGYKIPPHTHPASERVTVISGSVHLGMGEKFDETAGRELHAGDFAVLPAGLPHFAWATREAVLQIQSEGPFARKFVDPANEPPSTKK